MGWHRDDETGCQGDIASLSLGAERRFRIEQGSAEERRHIDLEHGSLMIFDGRQRHCLTKNKAASRRAHQPHVSSDSVVVNIIENFPVPNTLALTSVAEFGCLLRSGQDIVEAKRFARTKGVAFKVIGAGSNLVPLPR